jgi:hypothetical protein
MMGEPMLRVLGTPRRFCDGVSRREALTAGALSVLGGCFNLPNLLTLEARRPPDARPGKAKNVLLLYLHGGAPTQDMFDLEAAFVKDRPARPADLCATIYHCLGIDPEAPIADRSGRAVSVAQGGEPIREILV